MPKPRSVSHDRKPRISVHSNGTRDIEEENIKLRKQVEHQRKQLANLQMGKNHKIYDIVHIEGNYLTGLPWNEAWDVRAWNKESEVFRSLKGCLRCPHPKSSGGTQL